MGDTTLDDAVQTGGPAAVSAGNERAGTRA